MWLGSRRGALVLGWSAALDGGSEPSAHGAAAKHDFHFG